MGRVAIVCDIEVLAFYCLELTEAIMVSTGIRKLIGKLTQVDFCIIQVCTQITIKTI